MKQKSFLQKLLAAPHMVWTLLFIVAPLLFVAYYAFTDSEGSFTFDNILKAVEPDYMVIFFRSISLAIIATFICLIIAYPLAYSISRSKASSQKIMIMLVMLPMWMNFLIRTYSWMSILEDTGFINSMLSAVGLEPLHMINTSGAVVLGMVYNFLPYMILPIYSVMVKIDNRLIEAAHDLGCNNMGVMTKVILPLSISGVVSGVTMVFVPSISTFYISQKLGGGNFDLIGDTIERQFQTAYNYNLGAAISLILMVLILISMAVMNKFSDEDGGGMVV
ncbi:MAG: ABC transporter permease [Clostridia bacterium]|nr:ABC transporter permease [Clostridia bacterium]